MDRLDRVSFGPVKANFGADLLHSVAVFPMHSTHMMPALTIVTAADQKYWRSLYQFLRSAARKGLPRQHQFVVYDLGLDAKTLATLQRRFTWAEFRRFSFERHPPHVALERKTYAWKPLVIAEAMEAFGGRVLWLDSATIFKTKDLDEVLAGLARDGVYVLKGDAALAKRCDPLTLAALEVPLEFLDKRERPAGVIGLDTARPAVRALINEWCAHALIEAHIYPRIPQLPWHNPEQALLSILLFKHEAAGEIGLSDGEIDICSHHPVRWMSSRNKVPVWMPTWADLLPRLYYFFYKTGDRIWLRLQHWNKTRLDGFDRSLWEHFTVFVACRGQIARIQAPRFSYYADPFVWVKEGRVWLFVEEFQYGNALGRLCCVALGEGLRAGPPRPVLPMETHASFPLIFEIDGKTYMMPETSANRSVDLYVCEEFPHRWRLARRLFYGQDAADTAIVQHEGRWWLVTSLRDEGADPRYLAIFFSDDLFDGTWQPHPINAERRHANQPSSYPRNAGNIVRDGDTLLRVVQYNPNYYGESARVMKIELLTPTEFREVPYDGPHPFAAITRRCSPHHLSAHEDVIAWDVRDRAGYFNRAPARTADGALIQNGGSA